MTLTQGYVVFMMGVAVGSFTIWLVAALRDRRVAREQLASYRVEPGESWALEIAYAALFQRQHINPNFLRLLKQRGETYWGAIILDKERLVKLVNLGTDYLRAYETLYGQLPLGWD